MSIRLATSTLLQCVPKRSPQEEEESRKQLRSLIMSAAMRAFLENTSRSG